ncbi:MAG TPA: AI-2E family transporter [Longimicrobiaceae bacterium]|nr:AI-2E family transporter [Longimicrobiaceae bacterium]
MPDGGVRRITWRTADVARVFTLGVAFVFAWKFFWMVHNAIFLGLLAILIAIALHAPARFLARWLPFRVAFALVVMVFLGSLVGLAVLMIPQVVDQIGVLASQIPVAFNSVMEWMRNRADVEPNGELANRINAQFAQFVGRFIPLAFNLISAVLGSFAIVVLAIFLAAQPELYRDLLLRLIGPESREKWSRVYDEAGRSLRAWVIGKVFTMLFIGVTTWIGLELFRLPGALALAVLAAFMEFIPNFGPTLAAIPAILTAFTLSPATALYVAIFYFALQQVQNAITVPLVERRAVNIPPAALLAWQLILTIGFGVLALFVATPLLAVIVVAVRILYMEPAEELKAWDRRESSPLVTPTEAGNAPLPPPPDQDSRDH